MALLNSLPAGTTLMLPGHEMLYFGSENGKYCVVNDSSASMSIINALTSFFRKNEKTRPENLGHVVVLHGSN